MIPSKDPLLIIAALRRENSKLLRDWKNVLSNGGRDGPRGDPIVAKNNILWFEGYQAGMDDLKKGLK